VSGASEHARVLWRCRRGMKELDLLLGRYARERFPAAPESEREAFLRLLELPDPLLATYLLRGEAPADAALAGIVGRVAGPPHGGVDSC